MTNTSFPEQLQRLRRLIRNDPWRMGVLRSVRELGLPDCWIGAGFARNAVWDALHEIAPRAGESDIDVIWFDPARADPDVDLQLEARLRAAPPTLAWSVRNQARMHLRNGDAPYLSSTDAMRYWPETATAVALRCDLEGDVEVSAPYGLDDLWQGILRPTPGFTGERHAIFAERASGRGWLQRWPRLRVISDAGLPPAL